VFDDDDNDNDDDEDDNDNDDESAGDTSIHPISAIFEPPA